jgi:hypothetical protein
VPKEEVVTYLRLCPSVFLEILRKVSDGMAGLRVRFETGTT